MAKDYKESDMYQPVKALFERQGFSVKGEVKSFDLVGIKDNVIIVAELKKSFNLKLIYQAIKSQRTGDYVYVAIPRPSLGKISKKNRFGNTDMETLLKRLSIGLITVAMDSEFKIARLEIEAPESPLGLNNKKRQGLILEHENRKLDFNKGGTAKTKIVTAYREKSIELLCALNEKPLSLKELRSKGYTDSELRVLRNNPYGWFQRVAKGVYSVGEQGEKVLITPMPEFIEAFKFYKEKFKV